MNKVILLADSGSTKTDWLYIAADGTKTELRTNGINPARDTHDYIYNVVCHELMPQLPSVANLQEIHFYGAGCIDPFRSSVREVLESLLPNCWIEVESDLLGAARALCGQTPGIACILGTGSNSCLYDGKNITSNTPPLGYILGDEGSGTMLGKMLLNGMYKGILPDALKQEFTDTFQLTLPDIIERVYRKPAANTFLASLVPFLAEHRAHPAVHDLLICAFRQFFTRNIIGYNQPTLPVNFVGGIAFQFENELREAALAEGLKVGHIVRRPIEAIAKYHLNMG